MARKKTLYFPLEGTLRQDIKAVLALSDGRGQPILGKEQEWLELVVRIVRDIGSSLTVDGVMQLSDL